MWAEGESELLGNRAQHIQAFFGLQANGQLDTET